jgi:uncharacterized protein
MKSSRFNNVIQDGEKYLHHNTLYGGLFAADRDNHSKLHAILNHPDHHSGNKNRRNPLYNLLVRNRFLIDNDIDELQICREIMKLQNTQNRSLSVTIMLGYDCNFSCPYCFQRLTRRTNGSEILDQSNYDRFCSFLDEKLWKYDRLRMVWMGGEPLLHLKRLERYAQKVQEICHSKGVKSTNLVITNGFLLNESAQKSLEKLENLTIQITIDGPPEIHDVRRPLKNGNKTFLKIFENVQSCISRQMPVVIRVNVDDSNFAYLSELFEYFDHSIITDQKNIVHIARVDNTLTAGELTTPREYKAYAKIERKVFLEGPYRQYLSYPKINKVLGCPGLGHREYMLDGQGLFFKCPRYMEDEKFSVGSLCKGNGTILNDNVEIWESWDPLAQNKCQRCSLLPICMGGCPFNSIYSMGDNFCGETRYLYKSRLILQHHAQKRERQGQEVI